MKNVISILSDGIGFYSRGKLIAQKKEKNLFKYSILNLVRVQNSLYIISRISLFLEL